MTLPTLPKPCTATWVSSGRFPARLMTSSVTNATPRPVASVRPREPPSSTGFPVTTADECCPVIIVTVSTIQAIVDSSVFTSGAGMSFSGPMSGRIAAVYLFVRRST